MTTEWFFWDTNPAKRMDSLGFEFWSLPIRSKWNENKRMGNSSKTGKATNVRRRFDSTKKLGTNREVVGFEKFSIHQMKKDPRSYERNLCNCIRSLKKFRTSTGFEPVTWRYWCDALTNWAIKPLMLGAGQLCVQEIIVIDVYEMNHILSKNCENEIKWRAILAVVNAIYAIG